MPQGGHTRGSDSSDFWLASALCGQNAELASEAEGSEGLWQWVLKGSTSTDFYLHLHSMKAVPGVQ